MCDRVFRTRRGLGQHIKRAHPVEANDLINIDRTKPRWSREEVHLLAHAEAQATVDGIRFINIHLHDLFPTRTLEAIKGKRKEAEYKILVTNTIDASRRRSSIITSRRSTGNSNIEVNNRDLLIDSINESIRGVRNVDSRTGEFLCRLATESLLGIRNLEKYGEFINKLPHNNIPKGPLWGKTKAEDVNIMREFNGCSINISEQPLKRFSKILTLTQ